MWPNSSLLAINVINKYNHNKLKKSARKKKKHILSLGNPKTKKRATIRIWGAKVKNLFHLRGKIKIKKKHIFRLKLSASIRLHKKVVCDRTKSWRNTLPSRDYKWRGKLNCETKLNDNSKAFYSKFDLFLLTDTQNMIKNTFLCHILFEKKVFNKLFLGFIHFSALGIWDWKIYRRDLGCWLSVKVWSI